MKLDENLSQSPADFLKAAGYSADRVTDEGLSGAEDAVVWQHAVAEARFFLMLGLDFANVRRFPPGSLSHYVPAIAAGMPFRKSWNR